jgi:hypothetical protein
MTLSSKTRGRFLPDRPLPPYAYLPGRQPHPTRDPAGHSFQADPSRLTAPIPDTDSFRWGIDLFNHGYYWEAHEAWEALWRAAPEANPMRLILKGLILLAATAVKIREGKAQAAGRHAQRAGSLFRQAALLDYPATVLGVPVQVFEDRVVVDTRSLDLLAGFPSDQPQIVFDFVLSDRETTILESERTQLSADKNNISYLSE